MKLTRNLIFGMMAATSAVAVAGVGVTVAQDGFGFKNAEAVTPMRRIWALNNDNWWTTETTADDGTVYSQFKVHVWGGNSDLTAYDYQPMVRTHDDIGGDYQRRHLYYIDVPYDVEHVIFWLAWSSNNCTVTMDLPEFGTEDVFYLNSGTTWNSAENRSDRNCSRGSLSGDKKMGVGNVQWLLTFFDTCSDSSANGYMAYPQLMANFINGASLSEEEMGNQIFGNGPVDKGYGGAMPTIQEKLDAMRLKYEAATK
ncbi:MAG: hypothetical protein ACI32C_05815 [Candidatus Enteromonas sp.]